MTDDALTLSRAPDGLTHVSRVIRDRSPGGHGNVVEYDALYTLCGESSDGCLWTQRPAGATVTCLECLDYAIRRWSS